MLEKILDILTFCVLLYLVVKFAQLLLRGKSLKTVLWVVAIAVMFTYLYTTFVVMRNIRPEEGGIPTSGKIRSNREIFEMQKKWLSEIYEKYCNRKIR